MWYCPSNVLGLFIKINKEQHECYRRLWINHQLTTKLWGGWTDRLSETVHVTWLHPSSEHVTDTPSRPPLTEYNLATSFSICSFSRAVIFNLRSISACDSCRTPELTSYYMRERLKILNHRIQAIAAPWPAFFLTPCSPSPWPAIAWCTLIYLWHTVGRESSSAATQCPMSQLRVWQAMVE